ncbi:MAG TPA: DUF2520 domain-containing protein [Gemmatimonadales bacterium]|nr:DUF2520 domain-containing protein [Gemmatimonadales bacterium]
MALVQAGHEVRLHGRRGKAVPPPLRLSWGDRPPWLAEVDIVLLAVQDGAIAAAAAELAAGGDVTARHVVLHLSGMLDQTPLAALARTGAGLGVLHPLQAIAQPETAPDRLRGALAVLTGDERAVAAGEALARSIGLRPVVLAPPGKPRYHAAAAIASNYLVVLATVAERLMMEAGISEDAARSGIRALMAGTLANVSAEGPAALTGPIARGDVITVRAHLAVLPPDVRPLYVALGRVAAELAPLDGETRAAMHAILGEGEP